MGAHHSKSFDFESHEYSMLQRMYVGLAAQSVGNTVDKRTFMKYFNLPGMLGERVFSVFDQKKTGVIDQEEFMHGLSLYTKGSTEDRMRMLFRIYDLTGDNAVSRKELRLMLFSLVHTPQFLDDVKDVGDEDAVKINSLVEDIVTKAFATCNTSQSGKMNYSEFKKWMQMNPKVMQHLERTFAKHVWNKGKKSFHHPKQRIHRSPSLTSRLKCARCEFEIAACPGCGGAITGDAPHCISGCGNVFNTPNGVIKYCPSCGKDWERKYSRARRKSTAMSSLHETRQREITGELFKLRKVLKNFKSKHIVLRQNFMYEFDKEDEVKPTRVWFLEGLFVEPHEEDKFEDKDYYGFDLISLDATLATFYARTRDLRRAWVRNIRRRANTVPIDEVFIIGDIIGVGRFANVHRAIDRRDGRPYAIKDIHKDKVDQIDMEGLRAEIAILKLIHHPNIVRLKEVFESHDSIKIVLNLVAGGDLLHFLQRKKHIEEPVAKYIMFKMLHAVKFLHSHGVVHRDIKPENILLGDAEDPKCRQLFLADFGLSQFASPQETMRIAVGTIAYMAPEVLELQPYSKAVDVWGLGVTCFAILCGSLPFKSEDQDELIDLITDAEVKFDKEIWNTISDDAKDFILRTMKKRPKDRMTVMQTLNHPWLKDVVDYSTEFDSKFNEELEVSVIDTRTIEQVSKPAAIRRPSHDVSSTTIFEDFASDGDENSSDADDVAHTPL
jgi:serine/threonine protein kinase/Ca2+-binding EF-hand superfamily protein